MSDPACSVVLQLVGRRTALRLLGTAMPVDATQALQVGRASQEPGSTPHVTLTTLNAPSCPPFRRSTMNHG